MLTYEKAQKLVKKYCSEKLQLHVREAEIILRKIAKELGENEEKWGIAALLHDLDFEQVGEDYSQHGIKIQELVGKENLPDEIWHAIASHNSERTNIEKKTSLDYALSASENISGMIYATALIYPDKKVASVKPKSIKKRLKQTAFARNVHRESIYDIEKTGLTLDRSIELALEAMKEIADEIGL